MTQPAQFFPPGRGERPGFFPGGIADALLPGHRCRSECFDFLRMNRSSLLALRSALRPSCRKHSELLTTITDERAMAVANIGAQSAQERLGRREQETTLCMA